LESPIPAAGTIRFQLHTRESWQNGAERVKRTAKFLVIPGVAEARLQQTEPAVGLIWQWVGGPRFQTLIPELPGPETWHIQLAWNAPAGEFNVFVNGFAVTTIGVTHKPWEITGSVSNYTTFEDSVTVSGFDVRPGCVAADVLRREVPEEFLGKQARLFGQGNVPPPLDVSGRRGRLLVDNRFGSRRDVEPWVLEGPGEVTFPDGQMQMRSTRPDASQGVNGHIVFWCPHDFPGSFVCEWEVEIVSEFGLTIVFFAAHGAAGEDIFDHGLPARDGTFTHYIRGAIKSYHISYFASTPGTPGRATSNLRKNNRFHLMTAGPVAIPAKPEGTYRMRLIKDGAHIQLQANDRVSIDYEDPGGDRYGPVYGEGKIGLRQMQWTVARYRSFRVWELLPKPESPRSSN